MRRFIAMRTWAALLVLLSAALAAMLPGDPVRAWTITNVARADWKNAGGNASARSNSVVLEVGRAASSLSTYIASPSADQVLSVPAAGCSVPSSPNQPAGAAQRVDLPVRPVSRIWPGQGIILRVVEPAANIDPGAIDSVTVTSDTAAFGRQTITIPETGVNTGEFIVRLSTSAAAAAAPDGCTIRVKAGETARFSAMLPGASQPFSSAQVDVLADPFGTVFDAGTGLPVSGARITMVDAASGQPAQVFGPDGTTAWPSTVTTGEPIMDFAGTIHTQEPGQFWFPLARVGTYRLVVEPPAPFTAPSQASPARLAALVAPDGGAFTIVPASFGAAFALADAAPVQIDIPLDQPGAGARITRSVSRERAEPGDVVFHTITISHTGQAGGAAPLTLTEHVSPVTRLRPDTIRLNGQNAGTAATIAADGRTFTLTINAIAPGQNARITFAAQARADAPPGRAINRAEVSDGSGRPVVSSTSVMIERDTIAGKMTLIGRVSAGDCGIPDGRTGIAGVRLMLEDGSFAVTDSDGRYHFDGLVPGTHVVQLARNTLPAGGRLADCNRSTRNAGDPASRFIIGQGGSLAVADFAVIMANNWQPPAPESLSANEAARPEQAAAGMADWLALGDGPDGWLFPQADHNPRAPAIRVAIRHRKGQSVRLMADGKAVDPLTFDGTQVATDGTYAVSLWRGIALTGNKTTLTAEIINTLGGVSLSLARDVHFTSRPARFELVSEKSVLVADGVIKPVLAVRVLDPAGKPLRSGMTGGFTINPPHESASQLEQEQLRQVSAAGPAGARWRIDGDDGLALIELAPTMVSGRVRLSFDLTDAEITRQQELEAWLAPGDMEWTIVGLAEGSIGARSVADNMQRGKMPHSDLGDHARTALYAKGRVLGKYLLTLAYDSAKQKDDQPVLGTINPSAYYTVFADGSSRRFDAASREKLYVRIETATFHALYGDFQTRFDQTRLTRYTRTATGISAQGRIAGVQAEGFAARIASRFRRDEMQGAGITGPYPLRTRAIIANTERVAIETRDRFRSEIVVERRELARFTDYDVDLLAGTIRFRQPVASRDANLNPQMIVVEYEVDSLNGGEINAGLRASVATGGDRLRIGVTAVTDKGDAARTQLGGIDVRAHLSETTEVKAELAMSQSAGATATGWSVAAEHRSGSAEIIAYAQSLGASFGVGQQSGAELGRRKIGVDARTRIGDTTTATISAWQDESLSDTSRRRAAQLQGTHRSGNSEFRLGLSHFDDSTTDGRDLASTVLEAGATQRLLDKRLEITASTSLALDQAGSIDLPARHQLGARFAVTPNVRLHGLYELAKGSGFDARSLRGGVEVTPWQGGRINTDLGQRRSGPAGASTFAAFGLSQALQLTSDLTVDATLESSRTIGGTLPAADAVNPAQPPSSGARLSVDNSVFEDFTAVSLGGTYRRGRWTGMARGEYRDGDLARRRGLTFGAIRQMGEGSMVGSGVTWTRATAASGGHTEIIDAALALAHRPAGSAIAMLGKLAYRSDRMTGADSAFGEELADIAAGRTALITGGNALSRRLLASISANWTPRAGGMDGQYGRAAELGLFLAGRYSFDQFDGTDINSFAVLAGLDGHVSLTPALELGGIATLRSNISSGATWFSYGPTVGLVPGRGILLTLGYNVEGFRDIDFSALRETDQGPYLSVRMKFDADSFDFLGLKGRRHGSTQ